jgi:hypothetical protein
MYKHVSVNEDLTVFIINQLQMNKLSLLNRNICTYI